ncbi:citrate/2-methylcitrate synthase [Subtercola endophyticus]|uniref:citrate/2-methylcitrate synthase n=1 Tax=Subtercola endophyticus TaxID=2895559 RepID=UPI001E384D56|nr:citrate/2-methylcitrate synthase [Subtercola endophyticus]UFS60101.1 citrate synthase/methylcitrate synthase [Subtercola endophyticus]
MKSAHRLNNTPIEVPRGLTNVVVTETRLSDVRGQEGFYHYRQYSAVDLARSRSVEDVWHLLLDGDLPTTDQRASFAAEIASASRLGRTVSDALPLIAAATTRADSLAGLRVAMALQGASAGLRPLLDLTREERRRDLIGLAALAPTVIAAQHRIQHGHAPVESRPELGYVANYLYMLTGRVASPDVVEALSAYLVAAIDHGFSASTFTSRVIASTGADAASCLVGALGALSGPLHGGAPSRALDTLDEIGSTDNIDTFVMSRLQAGERIMGFGHPVYRTEDPRSTLLKQVAQRFGGARVDFAVAVEERIPVLLEKFKPGRQLHTNLEWDAAVVMELCGLDRELFTPTFAVARLLGWSANVLEQADDSKIIRPSARYVGPAAPQPVPSETDARSAA